MTFSAFVVSGLLDPPYRFWCRAILSREKAFLASDNGFMDYSIARRPYLLIAWHAKSLLATLPRMSRGGNNAKF